MSLHIVLLMFWFLLFPFLIMNGAEIPKERTKSKSVAKTSANKNKISRLFRWSSCPYSSLSLLVQYKNTNENNSILHAYLYIAYTSKIAKIIIIII